MKTSELLKELQENLLRDVSNEAVDDSAASLWSPDALVRYLDDAQNRMARQTECLLDRSTPEITRLFIVPDLDTYPLDKRIIRVHRARVAGKILKETSTSHEEDGSSSVREDLPRARSNPNYIARYSMDEGADTLRVFPMPTSDHDGQLMELLVSRLPAKPLTNSKPDREPEVPIDFHLDLVEWAAYRALRNHDVDSENIQKANIHRAAFQRAVDELRRQIRRKHAAPAVFGGRVHN